MNYDAEYIEPEEGNENVKAEIPFNPNDISISIVPRTIGQLVDMLRYGEILIPAYQRLPNLWDNKKKSRFIESLMLNLPIPLFYFDETEIENKEKGIKEKKWMVIDGLQRMSALEHLILLCDKEPNNLTTISGNKQPLVLSDLEFKSEFNDRRWDELPRDVQRRIENCQVTINLIQKGTPEEVKYNIFCRINQGGTELKAQEIRTALFQGYKIEFVENLISQETEAGKSFIKATDNSVPDKRQEDLDFATRFLSFYLLGYEKYEPDMDSFLTIGTKSIPKGNAEQEKILNDFQKAMNIAYEVFGQNAFRKITTDNQRNRINKPLFEVISVYFAKLDNREQNKLLQQKDICVKKFVQMLQQNKSFFDAITRGTATKDSVKKRHELFREFLNKFIL
jgi:hypothetical protein